jgi:excisionase family DNA binding protein
MRGKIEWYLPLSRAAELLNCTRRAVQELIGEGLLEAVRMPMSEVKVSEVSIHDYLKKNGFKGKRDIFFS